MAEYIDLNNTEVLAEAGENAKLVVEEDGELKRIPASAVGQVKAVNGVEPDEAGNVGVSYNNLLDKPFYETGWRYAWNGDTSNMTAVSTNGLGTLYMVSESVVDFDAMVGEVSVTVVSGGVEREIVTDITDEMVAMWEETGAMLLGEGSFIVFAVVDKDKMSADSELVELIPELNEMEVGVYFSEKTREIKSADYTVKPLDAKFLPEGVGPLLVTANTTNGTDYTFSHTGNEIAQHISMGGNAVMNASDGTVGLCYGYYMAISSNGSGQTPYIAFGVLAYAQSKPCLMLFLVPMDSTAGMSQMFALETYTLTPT